MHEYITIWSKDQLRLDDGGETGITGNQFVAWTRSIWRPEDLIRDLEKKILGKLADARKRDKDDAWIAESIARAVWGQAIEPGPDRLGNEHPNERASSGAVPCRAAQAAD